MSSNGERGFLAQVEARYKQTQALEKKALSLLKVKSPFDADVRVLRDSIRDNYEAILLSDYDFAAANDVELSLWSLHYRRIMEFRQRINAKATAVPIAETSGQRTTQKVRADSNKIAMQKLCAVFRGFLAEASGFYHNLIYKLRAKYGLPQDFSGFLKPEVSGNWSTCQKSCHRCLIYLGDLARYKELHGDSEGRNQDWTVAAGYYLQAAAVWPAGGNPHNQLAVLASYVNDELLSAYHYFRSLAVEIPFLTARDNLIMQFEKNRQRFLQLTPATGKEMRRRGNSMRVGQGLERGMVTIGDGAMRLAVKSSLDGKPTRPEGVVDYSDVQKSFNVRFVRLNGILFTKTSLETFSEVYASTLAELEQLLTMDDDQLYKFGALHKGMGSGGGGSSRFLQFVVMLIFTIENISWMPDTQQPSYVEILQRSLLYQHAFTVAFEFCGQLLSRCKSSLDPKKCPVFPALLVFLEWLSCHPGVVIGSDVGQQQANARAFFWEQMVGLLNNIMEREGGWNGVLGDYSASSVLWEDHELRGFQPIAKIQVSMDFSEPVTQADMWGDSQSKMRVRRFIEAAIAVASAAEEMGGSSAVGIGAMIWKQDVGKFQLPGVASDLSSPEVQQAVEAPQDLDASVVNGLDHGLNHNHMGISKELERLEVGEGPLTVGEGPGGHSPVSGNMKELVPVGAEWLVGEDDALGSWETPLEGEGSGYAGEMPDGPSDGEEEYEEVEEEVANLLEPEEEEVIVFRPVQNRQPLTGHQQGASTAGAAAAAMTTTATSSYVNTGNDMRSAAEKRDVWPSGVYEPVQHDMSSPWSSGILPGFSVPYSVAVHENIASKQSSVPHLSTIRPSGYSMAMGEVASPGGWVGNQESPENAVGQGQSRPSMPSFGAWLPGTGTTTSSALSTKGDSVSTGVIGQPKRNIATSAVLSDIAQIGKPYGPMEAESGFFGSRRVQVDIPVPKPLHSNPPPPSDYFGSTGGLTTGHLGTTPAPYSSSSSFWATSVGQHRDSIGAGWKLGVNGTGTEVDGVSEDATEMAGYGGGGSINTPSSSSTLQEAWHAMQSYGNAGSNLAAYGGATTLANNSKAPSVGVIGMQKVVKGGKAVSGPLSSQIWERDPHQMGAPSGILKDFAGSQDDYGWLDEFSQSTQLSSRSMQGHGQQLQQLPEDQGAPMKLQGNGSSLWSTPVTRERVGGNLPLYPGMTRGSDNLSRDPFVS